VGLKGDPAVFWAMRGVFSVFQAVFVIDVPQSLLDHLCFRISLLGILRDIYKNLRRFGRSRTFFRTNFAFSSQFDCTMDLWSHFWACWTLSQLVSLYKRLFWYGWKSALLCFGRFGLFILRALRFPPGNFTSLRLARCGDTARNSLKTSCYRNKDSNTSFTMVFSLQSTSLDTLAGLFMAR
jgi:hypothetical protein